MTFSLNQMILTLLINKKMSQLKFKMKILEISHTLNYTSLRVKRLKINVRLLKYLGTRDTPCELHFVSKQFIFFFFSVWWNTPRACEFSDIALGRCVICSNVLNQLLNSPHANCKSITDTHYKQFHTLPFFLPSSLEEKDLVM